MTLVPAVLFLFFQSTHAYTAEEQRTVDFRYSPVNVFSTICLPGDWLKTVVSDRGALGYDFGPGPYARPLTEVAVTLTGDTTNVVRQFYDDPRVPIAVTELVAGPARLNLRSFSLVEMPLRRPSGTFLDGKVERVGELTGTASWAQPEGPLREFLSDVAWGVNRPVRYRVRVPPGTARRIAVAVVEPYKRGAGQRVLLASIEGAPPVEIDALAEAPKNSPVFRIFDAWDTDRDGWLRVEMHASPNSPDPNVTMSAFWVFPAGTPVTTGDMLAGRIPEAEIAYSCGPELERHAPAPRFDAIVARAADSEPVVTVRTSRPLRINRSPGFVLNENGRPFLTTRPAFSYAAREGRVWTLSFPPGTRRVDVITAHGAREISEFASVPSMEDALVRARDYWLTTENVPRPSILLPDSGLQYVVNAGIRTMYQVREPVGGLFQFQPGPSVYRGLWVSDAVRLTDASLLLGDTSATRETLEAILRHQRPDGRVAVMTPYPMHRETPCFVYAACRFGRLSGDTSWLRARWPAVRAGLAWLWRLRESTLADTTAPFYGLFPPAFADGGLAGLHAEYGSVVWALIALKEARRTARWLGEETDAVLWKSMEDELGKSFRRAAARDARHDAHGNHYLPITVAEASAARPPPQAQWFLLMGVINGRVIPPDDPLVLGTLAMLQANRSQGLILNTGWLADGIWAWFAPYPGIAHIEAGHAETATDMLYAFANHATPLGTWVEEQLPRDAGTRTAGDVSNASGAALFLSFIRRFLIREDDEGITLLPALPPEWVRAGASLSIRRVPTEYGPVSLELRVTPGADSVSLRLSPMDGGGARGRPEINMRTFKELGFTLPDGRELPETYRGAWGEELAVSVRR